MPLEQILAKYATTAAALVLVFVLAIARAVSENLAYKRDLRGAQLYLLGFIGTEVLRKITPARWTAVDKLLYVAGLVLFAFGAIRGAASTFIHLRRTRGGVETPKILRDLVDAGLFVLALLVILQATLEIDLSTVIASSAVVSLVLGLALQETLGNLFAGLSLQAERPFAEGDWVRIGANGGRVLEIGWRATRILTGAGEVLTIPNNAVAKEAILNFSQRGAVLRKVTIGIGYEIPPNDFKALALDLLRSNARIVADPEPAVRTGEFAPTTITYELLFWVARHEEGGLVEDDVRSQLWYRLRRAGIEIPFPSTHVQLAPTAPKRAPPETVDVAAVLTRVELFAGIAEPLRTELARHASVVRFGRGEVILRQGDAAPSPFYAVAEGEVALRVRDPGRVEEEVARLGPGESFGEAAVLTGETRRATVVAVSDVTLVQIERAAFGDLFARSPDAARVLAEALARRQEGLSRAVGAAPPQPASAETQHVLDRLRDIFKHLR